MTTTVTSSASRSTAVTGAAQALRDGVVVLAHGGGGELMSRLIGDHVLKQLGNPLLDALTDGAILECPSARIVLTTDSFVVQPLEFPGGDIGRIAVCGTVNDLAVMGGKPLGLSLGLILEEGFPLSRLDRILASVRSAANEAGVHVVTGDTKVIERGTGAGMFINTAGVAALDERIRVGFDRIREGDVLLVNGTLGDHGMAVMSVRNGLEFQTPIVSDAAPLAGMIFALADAGVDVRFMRDATRGGLAGVLADVVERSGLTAMIEESCLPVRPEVRAAAEMLGFDVLSIANEGKALFIVPQEQADRALQVLRADRRGRDARRIGRMCGGSPAIVELRTASGGSRVVQRPYGEELPRIC